MAQSESHQTISANGMAWISAAENPVSAAKRLAAIFSSAGLNPVVLHQAKITGLQAVVVHQLQALQVLLTGFA